VILEIFFVCYFIFGSWPFVAAVVKKLKQRRTGK